MIRAYEIIRDIIGDKVANSYYIEKTFRELGLDKIFQMEEYASRSEVPLDLIIKDQFDKHKDIICEKCCINETELNEILEKILEDEELQKKLTIPKRTNKI